MFSTATESKSIYSSSQKEELVEQIKKLSKMAQSQRQQILVKIVQLINEEFSGQSKEKTRAIEPDRFMHPVEAPYHGFANAELVLLTDEKEYARIHSHYTEEQRDFQLRSTAEEICRFLTNKQKNKNLRDQGINIFEYINLLGNYCESLRKVKYGSYYQYFNRLEVPADLYIKQRHRPYSTKCDLALFNKNSTSTASASLDDNSVGQSQFEASDASVERLVLSRKA